MHPIVQRSDHDRMIANAHPEPTVLRLDRRAVLVERGVVHHRDNQRGGGCLLAELRSSLAFRELGDEFEQRLDRIQRVHRSNLHVVRVGRRRGLASGQGRALGSSWSPRRERHRTNLLLTSEGESVGIAAIHDERLEEEVSTYNMHVAEVSSYFVGDERSILVHNSNPKFDGPLWRVFGKKAGFCPGDTDGVSVWKTESTRT